MSEKLCAIKKGSSGESANLGSKSITANGTYTASSDNLDGYDTVTVNVSRGYFELKSSVKLSSSGKASVSVPVGGKIRSAILSISGGTGSKYLYYGSGLFPSSGYVQAGGDGGSFSVSCSGSGTRTLSVTVSHSWAYSATLYYTIYYSL